MKYVLLAVISLSFLLGCGKDSSQSFYEIVNEYFLSFTDTFAYETGSLFLIPNDTAKYDKAANVLGVGTSTSDDQRLARTLKAFLLKSERIDFTELLSAPEIFAINLSQFTNVGRFHIIPAKLANTNNDSVIGKIWFSNFKIKNDKALLIVSKQASPKSGVSNGYLFKKQKDKWKIDTVIELEKW